MNATLASVSFIVTASEGLDSEGHAGFRENLCAFLSCTTKPLNVTLAWLFSKISILNSLEITLSRASGLLANQLPFGCDKAIKQHLPAALIRTE